MDTPNTGEDNPSTCYNNPDLPRISESLADILDQIGFSDKHRKHRIKLGVMNHMVGGILTAIHSFGEVCELRVGSSIEGTTAEGMGSDMDILMFSTSVRAYCNTDETINTLGVVFARDEITPAGYTKLQPANEDCINKYAHWKINLETDSKGRRMVAHFTDFYFRGVNTVKHGPAESVKNRPDEIDTDVVRSFLCHDITNEMKEWCMRGRIHNWPSEDTRDLFKTLGCFVVPVGHPSSPEKHIEWRMSFSLQERHLMWQLNPTQYHCFMLLKLIKTFLIKRRFGDVLTSYHCKTLLFYTIEIHDQGIWIPTKLIECLRMCLILLHEWISHKYIPNYFIPKENMFVKMDAALKGNYDDLKSHVAAMCNNWVFLFNIFFNEFGKYFHAHLNGKQVHEYIQEDLPLCSVSGSFTKQVFLAECIAYIDDIRNTLDFLDIVEAVLQSSRTCSRYTTFEENILDLYKQWFGRYWTLNTLERAQLIESYRFRVEDRERQPRLMAVMMWKSEFLTSLGSVLAARYFQTGNKKYLRESDTYLELGKSLMPMTCTLIKATVLLKQSLFDTSDVLLNEAEIISKDKMFRCFCYKYIARYCVEGVQKPRYVTLDDTLFSNTADMTTLISPSCLCFKRCEYDILPEPLTFEAYRSFGIPTNTLSQMGNHWVDMVVVDPARYLYYLQFLNNQHNNPGEAAVALHKLENTLFDRLRHTEWPRHIDTWLNVLGDVFVKKGWKRLALRCFRYSDTVRPLHNAVRWHVMFLLFSPSCDAIYTMGTG